MTSQSDFGLYVHVPFCERKCGYCSFYSVIVNDSRVDSWLHELEANLEILREKFLGNYGGKIRIRTLYFGGGTPSVLGISVWEKLFGILRENFVLENCVEATVEANPNSLNENLLSFLRDNHVTRISLGVQSLNDHELEILGRLHDSKQALHALELVKNYGFDLNADLIFAIPEQNIRSWDKSLSGVINSGADHISTYQLTLEPDSRMYASFGNVDFNVNGYYFYRYAQYVLPRKNFQQYEISNFATENHECIHNLSYWKQENMLALGRSASGYIDGTRYKFSHENSELELESEKLDINARAREAAILLLRTKYGIAKREFISEFGSENFSSIERILKQMPDDLFVRTRENLALSAKGMRVGNAIWSEII